MSVSDNIAARIKVRAYKNIESPDGRESLCGSPRQICPDTGREFFEVPAHQRGYLVKLLASYDFTEEYEVGPDGKPVKGVVAPVPKPKGRPPLPKVG